VCVEPAAIGLVETERAEYSVWGKKMDDESAARLAALRTAA